jgi:hypothetical protein
MRRRSQTLPLRVIETPPLTRLLRCVDARPFGEIRHGKTPSNHPHAVLPAS